jgi:hypothetical protein
MKEIAALDGSNEVAVGDWNDAVVARLLSSWAGDFVLRKR